MDVITLLLFNTIDSISNLQQNHLPNKLFQNALPK